MQFFIGLKLSILTRRTLQALIRSFIGLGGRQLRPCCFVERGGLHFARGASYITNNFLN